MASETELANQMGVENPVHNCIEDTHAMYHDALDTLLSTPHRTNVMVATHNEYTCEYTLNRMAELGISQDKGGVYFGQLLGMADHLTFAMGKAGYKAYKYLPYGPIQEVMPYLIRRAQENSDVMSGNAKQSALIRKELKSRFF